MTKLTWSSLAFQVVVVLLAASAVASAVEIAASVKGEREVYFFGTSALRVENASVSGRDLPDYLSSTLSAYLSLPERAGCIHLLPIERESDALVSRSNLAEASRNAEGVLRGRVSALSTGFRSTGEAGTLIRVEGIEVMKGGWLKSQRSYYAFIPVGQFEFGGKRICAEASGWVEIPQVNDEVILFVPYAGWSDEAFLEIYDSAGLVVLKKEGRADLPKRYVEPSNSGAPSISEVKALVADSIRHQGLK
ncbi:MAG: hypothetical protein ABI639_16340 [Thermoanaerobaculia bacterium]